MGKIIIECENTNLLNMLLSDIAGHFNKKQDNFKLDTIGFEIYTEEDD